MASEAKQSIFSVALSGDFKKKRFLKKARKNFCSASRGLGPVPGQNRAKRSKSFFASFCSKKEVSLHQGIDSPR
jgi:hypothetical protein